MQVRMSVSSEIPVLSTVYFQDRWQRAYEILDHRPGSVDLSRAKEGLVILDRHYGDQIGLMRLENMDGKMGGVVEFCTGQRAQEIAADAAKGLRRNVSVGYQVRSDSYRLEGEKDGYPVVRAMSWMPYEASFEPVPADTTVGVNRSDKQLAVEPAAKEQTRRKVMEPKEMQKLFSRAQKYGIDAEKVSEIDMTDAVAARAALDAMIVDKQEADLVAARKAAEAKPVAPEMKERGKIDAPAVVINKEHRYSVMNVIRKLSGMKADCGLEMELSDELANQRGTSAKGIIIPHVALAKRDFTVSGTSSASVSTDLLAGEFIDLLRTRSILGAAGVRFLTGLSGNVAIPKMTAGATGYWVSEGGDITESQPTLGQVTGTPHTCGVMTDISRRLILQSTPAAEMLVRDEIVERIIRTIQVATFAGTGSDGQPSAITTATGINNPTIATAGTPTYTEILSFLADIEADSATADDMKWIMTSEVWAKLAATFTNATYGEQALANWASKTMIGYPYLLTEDVPANSLWFGNWATVNIGVWGNGIDINVDDKTLSSSGGVRIVGLQDVDVMVRQGKALSYNTAVTA
jgi:HK97 family phage major capsid protein